MVLLCIYISMSVACPHRVLCVKKNQKNFFVPLNQKCFKTNSELKILKKKILKLFPLEARDLENFVNITATKEKTFSSVVRLSSHIPLEAAGCLYADLG